MLMQWGWSYRLPSVCPNCLHKEAVHRRNNEPGRGPLKPVAEQVQNKARLWRERPAEARGLLRSAHLLEVSGVFSKGPFVPNAPKI